MYAHALSHVRPCVSLSQACAPKKATGSDHTCYLKEVTNGPLQSGKILDYRCYFTDNVVVEIPGEPLSFLVVLESPYSLQKNQIASRSFRKQQTYPCSFKKYYVHLTKKIRYSPVPLKVSYMIHNGLQHQSSVLEVTSSQGTPN